MATHQSPDQDRRVDFVSRATLDAVDGLMARFPHVTSDLIYQVVDESREVADRHLDNPDAYRDALIDEATLRLYGRGVHTA